MSSTMFNKPLDTEFVGKLNGVDERLDELGEQITSVQNGLGAAASKAVANNLTTSSAGSVLDARQGKVLNTAITDREIFDRGGYPWFIMQGGWQLGPYVTSDGVLKIEIKNSAGSVIKTVTVG